MKQALIGVLALAGSLTLAAAGPRTFTVDTSRSKALIDVGKSGAFSFAGHTHEVEAPLTSGVVHFDPDTVSKSDLRLEFNTAAMKVTGKGDPPADVPKVTEAMLGQQVLDAHDFTASARCCRRARDCAARSAPGSARTASLPSTARANARCWRRCWRTPARATRARRSGASCAPCSRSRARW